ncbi:MAG: NAD(P)-dependent oxidoreductase, partial [Phycisphaeraceae bacterium]
ARLGSISVMPKCVITETLDPNCADWLAERCEIVWHAQDAPDLDAQLADADALVVRTYTQVDQALLDRAPNVKVIGRAGVGLDNFDLPACEKRGVRVVYTPDANTQAVVEYVFGLILDHYRPRTTLAHGTTAQDFHQLRKTEVGVELADLTLGILGMGRIGKRIATAAHAMGINVLGCDLLDEPTLRKAIPNVPFDCVDHETLYENSDILTVHTDGRPTNRHLIDADALSRLRDDALFINAARGMLVDHAALAEWLKTNPNAAAILDVHDPEPPAEDHPLYALGNARLLPHLASRTDTALKNMSWVVRDVAAVLEGREPTYPAV